MNDERLGLPSASKMGRIAHCAGCLQLESEVGEKNLIIEFSPEVTEVSTRGDRIHAALKDGTESSMTDEEEKEIAERLAKRRDGEVESWHAHVGKDPRESRVIKEERLWIKDRQSGVNICSAQLDLGYINGEEGLVIDYKSGYKSPGPTTSNYQIRTQAIALRQNFPQVKRVRGIILSNTYQRSADIVDYSEPELNASERELLVLIWRSAKPDAERIPGSWCDYCPAKAHCLEAGAFTMLPISYVDRHNPDFIRLKKKDVGAVVAKLELEQLAYLKQRAALIRNILNAVESRLKSLPNHELNSVGLSMTKGGSQREISNLIGMYNALNKKGWLTKEEFFALCEMSITKLSEKILPKVQKDLGLKTQKEAQEEIDKAIEPFIERKPVSGRIVEASNNK